METKKLKTKQKGSHDTVNWDKKSSKAPNGREIIY